MATAATREAPDSVCSICHELYRDPKVLWCGHMLCAPCVMSWLTSQEDAPCPVCHRPIVPPDSGQGQNLQSFIDSLPTDITMKIWVESQQLLSQDHACQSCVTQAATSLCLHCRDFLCSPCADVHGLSSLSHQQVETLSSLTPQKLAASCCAPCQAHPTELSGLYCSTHQVSICVLCATSKHRNCAEVKDMEERAAETQAVLKDVVANLTDKESQLDWALQELERLDQDIKKVAQAAETEINATFDGLEATLKRRRLQAKESSRGKIARAKASVRDTRASIFEKQGSVTTHRVIAEEGESMTTSGDVGEMAVAMKKRAEDINSNSMVPTDAQVIATATFMINSEAVSAAEKALAQLELGEFKATPAEVAAQVSQFCFHSKCGKNIVLSNNQQTAERKGRDEVGGIVLSSQPMVPHWLYEVHLDKREAKGGYSMPVGAVTIDPDSRMMSLPRYSGQWPSAVVFNSFCVDEHGTRINTKMGKKLKNLPKGSRVGVMIDDSGSLHLYIDGEDQGHAGTTLTQPCFAFFHVYAPYRKITALQVTVVP